MTFHLGLDDATELTEAQILGQCRIYIAAVRMAEAFGCETVRGVAKSGEIVWSRIFVEAGRLKMDLGRARVAALPPEETERRWAETTR